MSGWRGLTLSTHRTEDAGGAGERGQALLELLLVLPLFLLLTGAIIGLGWAYWVRLNQSAYVQDASTRAGKARSVAEGRLWAARFSAATNVDLDEQASVYWLSAYRGVHSQAHYQAPRLLLYDLEAPIIQTGAFTRWERFYPGPPGEGSFE